MWLPGARYAPPRGVAVGWGCEGAAKAMFAKRRAGVFLRVRSWARFDLSYLGRLHVAKQVLANTFCYHATFVAPPPDWMCCSRWCIV